MSALNSSYACDNCGHFAQAHADRVWDAGLAPCGRCACEDFQSERADKAGSAPEILVDLFGEENALHVAKKCLTDPLVAALVKIAQRQRATMHYARNQLATLTGTDHYGNAVANAYTELEGALGPAPDAKTLALLTAPLWEGDL